MTKDEALKLALEALEDYVEEYGPHEKDSGAAYAITAIKEALAQPEQEPHSWYSKQEDEWMTHKIRMEHERLNSYTHKVGKFDLALYTSPPPQRKPLTDEEIDRVTDQQWANNNHKPIYAAHRAYARAIEAAHCIKGKA